MRRKRVRCREFSVCVCVHSCIIHPEKVSPYINIKIKYKNTQVVKCAIKNAQSLFKYCI